MNIKSLIISFSGLLIGIALNTAALARDISLYDEPKDNAKILGKIDIEAGVVPIFSTKGGEWMKVGDPRNGNVGWIKSSDTQIPGQPNAISFTQKVINDSKGDQHTYQLMQYGKPAQQQSDELIQKMEKQQRAIRDSMQKAFQDVILQLDNVNEWNKAHGMPEFPMIVPVIVMPSAAKPALKSEPVAPAANKK